MMPAWRAPARPFRATGDSGDVYLGDSVVIATGAQARWLGIPGGKELSGFGVSARLRGQLLRLQPGELRCEATGRTTVIARPGDKAVAQWARLQPAARVLDFDHPLDWNSDPGSSNAMVPSEALKQLLATMNE